MKRIVVIFLFSLVLPMLLEAQNLDSIISKPEVRHIISALADDSMQGRRIFTPGIEKAAGFISSQFEKSGLQTWPGLKSYYQRFSMISAEPETVSIRWNGKELPRKNLIAVTVKSKIRWTNQEGIRVNAIHSRAELRQKLQSFLHPTEDAIVWIPSKLEATFQALSSYLSTQRNFRGTPSVVFVLADTPPEKFDLKIKNRLKMEEAANVIGYLPGTSKPNEYVVFSAHYDHLGIDTSLVGDSLFNGANDDASGTTAVIALARYFSQKPVHDRSLIFVAFTGEEAGGYGSGYFSEQLNPEKVVAMLNIEMIGTTAKWGENTAYITGFEKSDLGEILQRNLENTSFSFNPDPYPKQNLFYRSDNATLARFGVPAHTISTAKMDNEPHYHQVSDEVNTLDIENMTHIIHAIARSAQSMINGEDTPSRLDPQKL